MRKERLELSRGIAPLEPKSSASTSSATFASKNSFKPKSRVLRRRGRVRTRRFMGLNKAPHLSHNHCHKYENGSRCDRKPGYLVGRQGLEPRTY